ncbi:Subtilase family protein [Anaerovirgula multivorans]|uniref:Subtilase family protein n=1 Tax=Anaerovirgula multivorans TaxID=312168 RepID=A0A239F5G5_9FIRM|nr:S8 family peptidase [Anaerovirgula multivorans]SNS51981.1 Subtilase family protein [Anaerovirgula multivorans]
MKYDKIAPGLTNALEDYKREGVRGLLSHERRMGLIVTEDTPKPPRVIVLIDCDETAQLDHLAAHGIRVNQPKGQIRTGFLPLEKLDILSEEAAIRRIIPSHPLMLRMDVGRSKVHLPPPSQSPWTGKNVIIGIIDTGIDPKHPAFEGRILRIWDQIISGPGVAEGDYGIELTGPLLEVSRDTNGHGTHVAGIASGNDEKYLGIAPEAEFVIVKSDLQTGHIIDGLYYIFRVAEELGRPAVINLSLGGHADPHDGSDPLSIAIDTLSGKGRIVCCAAGNEGNDNIHAQATVSEGETCTVRFHVPSSMHSPLHEPIRTMVLNGWYSGTDQVEVAIQSPQGFTTPFQGPITNGLPRREYDLPEGFIRIVTPGPDLENGDHNIWIEIYSPSNAPESITSGNWHLLLRGLSIQNGRVDIWTLDDSYSDDVIFTDSNMQDSMKIGSPGAAHRAITVASYTTKVQWTDSSGEIRRAFAENLDQISSFSSEGPLRNGVEKPDVAAPGAYIISALSKDSSINPAFKVDDHHRVMAGTSMATPFISGVIALLLEKDSTMDPEEVKAWLKKDSSIPGYRSEGFHPKWGYGLIDLNNL